MDLIIVKEHNNCFGRKLFDLIQDTAGQWHNKEVFMCGPNVCTNGMIGQYAPHVMAFGEDEEGRSLYTRI